MKAEYNIGKTGKNRERCLFTELTRLHSINDRRRAATLYMTEYRNARFNVRMFSDEVSDLDAAARTFGNDDVNITLSLFVGFLDLITDLFEIKILFRYKNIFCAA